MQNNVTLKELENQYPGFYDCLHKKYGPVSFSKNAFISEFCAKLNLPDPAIIVAEILLELTGGHNLTLSAKNTQEKINSQNTYLLDFREAWERKLARIENAQVLDNEMWNKFQNLEISLDSCIIVYCHFGIKSQDVVSRLRQLGYTNSFALQGGIDAWSLQIDSTIPRYEGEWC